LLAAEPLDHAPLHPAPLSIGEQPKRERLGRVGGRAAAPRPRARSAAHRALEWRGRRRPSPMGLGDSARGTGLLIVSATKLRSRPRPRPVAGAGEAMPQRPRPRPRQRLQSQRASPHGSSAIAPDADDSSSARSEPLSSIAAVGKRGRALEVRPRAQSRGRRRRCWREGSCQQRGPYPTLSGPQRAQGGLAAAPDIEDWDPSLHRGL
jgi:hypothetical protein